MCNMYLDVCNAMYAQTIRESYQATHNSLVGVKRAFGVCIYILLDSTQTRSVSNEKKRISTHPTVSYCS